MKISIRTEENRRFFIILPLFLVTNRISMHFINKYVKIDGLHPDHIKLLVTELKKIKKHHGKFELIHVESSDHAKVTITL